MAPPRRPARVLPLAVAVGWFVAAPAARGGTSAVAPPAPVAAATPAVPAVDDEDYWPLEYVRRPQTLRRGMISMGIDVSGIRPDATVNVDPGTGTTYDFYSTLIAGPFVHVGVTDRMEVGAWMPQAACFDSGEPSACSPWNRYNGTGFGFMYGALRRERLQGAFNADVAVAAGSPLRLRWLFGGSVKVLPLQRLALVAGLWLERSFDPPPGGLNNPLLATLMLDTNLQLTRRLLTFVTVVPRGSLGDLGQGIALRISGGLSFSFSHHVQAMATAGSYDVFEPRPWDHGVKASFATVELLYWHY